MSRILLVLISFLVSICASPAQCGAPQNIELTQDYKFTPGVDIVSSGEITLRFSSRGDLECIRRNSGVEYLCWSSQWTEHSAGSYIKLQSDGNIVIYNGDNKPVWASNTQGQHGVDLGVQDDGNVVLYTKMKKPVWATNTMGAHKDIKMIASFERKGLLYKIDLTQEVLGWMKRGGAALAVEAPEAGAVVLVVAHAAQFAENNGNSLEFVGVLGLGQTLAPKGTFKKISDGLDVSKGYEHTVREVEKRLAQIEPRLPRGPRIRFPKW